MPEHYLTISLVEELSFISINWVTGTTKIYFKNLHIVICCKGFFCLFILKNLEGWCPRNVRMSRRSTKHSSSIYGQQGWVSWVFSLVFLHHHALWPLLDRLHIRKSSCFQSFSRCYTSFLLFFESLNYPFFSWLDSWPIKSSSQRLPFLPTSSKSPGKINKNDICKTQLLPCFYDAHCLFRLFSDSWSWSSADLTAIPATTIFN